MLKVALVDIETAPMLAHVWGLWKQNVGLNQVLRNGYIMSFALKDMQDDVVVQADCRNGGEKDEKLLLEVLVHLLEQYDVVVAHNGDGFDLPWIRTRCIYHGIKPPAPIKQVDTLKVAKSVFAFHSNRLEFLAKFLGCDIKDDHKAFPGHEMWKECILGNVKAWEAMAEYNIQDVHTLEQVYKKLLPYIKGHPNMRLDGHGQEACPNCGGHHLEKRGFAFTRLGKFQRYHCKDCGGWSRSRKRLLVKQHMDNLLVNVI